MIVKLALFGSRRGAWIRTGDMGQTQLRIRGLRTGQIKATLLRNGDMVAIEDVMHFDSDGDYDVGSAAYVKLDGEAVQGDVICKLISRG